MRLLHELRIIVNCAVGRGILHERAENSVVEFELREVIDLHFDAERFRARANDFDRFRMTIVRDEKDFPIRNRGVTERHCLGRARRFVEHRRVRDFELRQINDHLLEVDQRFEASLRELSLIRRVSGVPTRIFQNVPLNDGRRDAIRVTGANKTFVDFVLLGNRAELSQRVVFRFRFRQIQFMIETDIFRNGRVDQGTEIFKPDLAQHVRGLVFVRTNVTTRKVIDLEPGFLSRVH